VGKKSQRSSNLPPPLTDHRTRSSVPNPTTPLLENPEGKSSCVLSFPFQYPPQKLPSKLTAVQKISDIFSSRKKCSRFRFQPQDHDEPGTHRSHTELTVIDRDGRWVRGERVEPTDLRSTLLVIKPHHSVLSGHGAFCAGVFHCEPSAWSVSAYTFHVEALREAITDETLNYQDWLAASSWGRTQSTEPSDQGSEPFLSSLLSSNTL